LEAVLEANRGLADFGPILPAGVTITLPDLAVAPASAQTVRFWD
jgi:phage tail protein X